MSTAERLEELRILPRVSAEDRERYEIWNRQARITLAEVDPPHAAQERIAHICVVAADGAARRARGYVPRHVSMRQWFQDWRSLPDYDGPPMRAPSGPVWEWERYFDGSVELDVPFFGSTEQEGRTQHDTLQGRLSNSGAEYVPQKEEQIAFAAPSRELFSSPSEGGRGWCPKLAGVVK